MHAIIWFRDNVLSNAIADIIVAAVSWAITMWRLEKQHNKHMDAIHNQISQELANVTEKSNA